MKKRHIQTNFIKFIIEKYSNDQEPQIDIEDEDEIEIPEEETEETEKPQSKKVQNEDEDLEDTEDDDIIDELLQEYKKVKKQYENRRLSNRRKR